MAIGSTTSRKTVPASIAATLPGARRGTQLPGRETRAWNRAPGCCVPFGMSATHRILPFLALLVALAAAGGPWARASDDPRPPIDREEHETVKTATFALG